MVIGLGVEENFVASDVAALLPVTRRFIFLEEGDVAEIRRTSVRILDREGNSVDRSISESELSADAAEKGQYRHFMLKEIHEQPRAVAEHAPGARRQRPLARGGIRPRGVRDIAARGERAHRRVRHELSCRRRRPLLHRADLQAAVRGGDRKRIPLSQSARAAQFAVRDHLAVRRDRRYARGAAARQAVGIS